ncbi:MAG: hypothetical protein KKH33_02115 [Alphaproteobacteria bacterium]|nr:hypothetical protein [Alphaproteobacteria bacterium]
MEQHIIDFQSYRLRCRHEQLSAGYASFAQRTERAEGVPDNDALMSDTQSSLVTALVLRIARRRGRSLNALPGTVRDALCDLVAQNDPTARLLFQWLDREPDTDEAILEAARLHDRWRGAAHMWSRPTRVYRHHRFWQPDSPRLAELDRRRLSELQSLLEDEMRHDR